MRVLIIGLILVLWVSAASAGMILRGSTLGGGTTISEDFTSCTDWTTISDGGVTCSGGYGVGTTDEVIPKAYYTTSTGGINHYVRATSLEYPAANRSASLTVRNTGSSWYSVLFTGSSVAVFRNDGNWDTAYDGSYSYGIGTFYDVRVEVTGTNPVNIKVFVGNMTTPVIDANDSSVGRLQTGNYVGVEFARNSGDNPRIDNLTGDAL